MIKFNSRNKDKWVELSNMCGAGFWIRDNGEKIWMNCVEVFYCYCKSEDKDYRRLIRLNNNGFNCKKLGKTIELRENWNEIKIKVMKYALDLKFSNEKMKALLLSTGEEELVENSPWDEFWGCGRNGEGLNWLGRLLMEIRDNLG